MIYLGTDIIDISRIRKNLNENYINFINKIFTDKEIKYCESKADPAIHFAGRFAGKEATKKALFSAGVVKQISNKEIEIISLNNIPKVKISAIMNSVNISISHTNNLAVATAIIIE